MFLFSHFIESVVRWIFVPKGILLHNFYNHITGDCLIKQFQNGRCLVSCKIYFEEISNQPKKYENFSDIIFKRKVVFLRSFMWKIIKRFYFCLNHDLHILIKYCLVYTNSELYQIFWDTLYIKYYI